MYYKIMVGIALTHALVGACGAGFVVLETTQLLHKQGEAKKKKRERVLEILAHVAGSSAFDTEWMKTMIQDLSKNGVQEEMAEQLVPKIKARL